MIKKDVNLLNLWILIFDYSKIRGMFCLDFWDVVLMKEVKSCVLMKLLWRKVVFEFVWLYWDWCGFVKIWVNRRKGKDLEL